MNHSNPKQGHKLNKNQYKLQKQQISTLQIILTHFWFLKSSSNKDIEQKGKQSESQILMLLKDMANTFIYICFQFYSMSPMSICLFTYL